jgi:hypothetical protein
MYTFGAAAGANELLEAIKDFLTVSGWTIDAWADDNSTYRNPIVAPPTSGKRLHVHRDDAYGQTMYFNLRSAYGHAAFQNSDKVGTYTGKYSFELHGIGINGSTGAYSAGQPWDTQSGYPQCDNGASMGTCAWVVGPANYWIVENGDTVIVVVEDATDKYSWIAFGSLDKTGAGTYTGGQFISGTSSSYDPWYRYQDQGGIGTGQFLDSETSTLTTWINVAESSCNAIYLNGPDGIAGWVGSSQKMGDGGNSTTSQAVSLVTSGVPASPTNPDFNEYRLSRVSGLACEGAPNNLSSVTIMLPIYFFSLHAANAQLRLLGNVVGIRQIAMNAIANESEFTLGGDTWKCFPARSRTCSYPYAIPGFAILIS